MVANQAPDPSMNDPEATRRRLAAALAALDADPQNVELITQVRNLECALEALEFHFARDRWVSRVLLQLDGARRRN